MTSTTSVSITISPSRKAAQKILGFAFKEQLKNLFTRPTSTPEQSELAAKTSAAPLLPGSIPGGAGAKGTPTVAVQAINASGTPSQNMAIPTSAASRVQGSGDAPAHAAKMLWERIVVLENALLKKTREAVDYLKLYNDQAQTLAELRETTAKEIAVAHQKLADAHAASRVAIGEAEQDLAHTLQELAIERREREYLERVIAWTEASLEAASARITEMYRVMETAEDNVRIAEENEKKADRRAAKETEERVRLANLLAGAPLHMEAEENTVDGTVLNTLPSDGHSVAARDTETLVPNAVERIENIPSGYSGANRFTLMFGDIEVTLPSAPSTTPAVSSATLGVSTATPATGPPLPASNPVPQIAVGEYDEKAGTQTAIAAEYKADQDGRDHKLLWAFRPCTGGSDGSSRDVKL